jgi:hypothetical protein
MNKKKGKDSRVIFFIPPFFIIIKNGQYRDVI